MQMRQQLHIVDNLTQVADDMIAYILQAPDSDEKRAQHRDEVATILSKVEAQYKAPTSSYFSPTAWVLWATRSRTQELETAKSDVNAIAPKDTTLGMLETITRLLEKGGVEATSANTTLLNELIAKLNKYQSLDKETELSPELQTTIRKRLRVIFVANAHATLNEYKTLLGLSDKQPEEKTVKPRQKLTADKTAAKSKLEKLFAERLDPSTREVQTSKKRKTDHLRNEDGSFKNQRHKLVAAQLASIHGGHAPISTAGLFKPEIRHEHNHNTEPNEQFKAAQRELEAKLGSRFKK